jgi:hypothetical protein
MAPSAQAGALRCAPSESGVRNHLAGRLMSRNAIFGDIIPPVGGVGETRVTSREARVTNGMGDKAASTLAPRIALVILRLVHPRRVGCSKTTGQIQNREDSFGPGIFEMPTLICAKRGFEFGAQVRNGISRAAETPTREAWCVASCKVSVSQRNTVGADAPAYELKEHWASTWWRCSIVSRRRCPTRRPWQITSCGCAGGW